MWGATAYPVDRCEELVVSIHAPHVGCDVTPIRYRVFILFQFTHPMWGATLSVCNLKSSSPSFNSRTPCGVRHTRSCPSLLPRRFNSRTPCGVRPSRGVALRSLITVSIHAPHVGCDFLLDVRKTIQLTFQFTHPMWGATMSLNGLAVYLRFQFTHPMWGATTCLIVSSYLTMSFNSRTPCGVRPSVRWDIKRLKRVFQFTHPMWGATASNGLGCQSLRVSIHAPRAGCD